MNAAANTDRARKQPPKKRPPTGKPDPEEGRVQRRNPPDPAIDKPFSDVIHRLISASGRTRKDIATAAGISEWTANDLVWGRRAWTLRNAILVPREVGYRLSETLILAGLDRPAMSVEDAIRSDTQLNPVEKQSLIATYRGFKGRQ